MHFCHTWLISNAKENYLHNLKAVRYSNKSKSIFKSIHFRNWQRQKKIPLFLLINKIKFSKYEVSFWKIDNPRVEDRFKNILFFPLCLSILVLQKIHRWIQFSVLVSSSNLQIFRLRGDSSFKCEIFKYIHNWIIIKKNCFPFI